jgi:methylenetetrahydrofolate reductase (NADPH)
VGGFDMLIREVLKKNEKGISFEFFPPKSPSQRKDFMAVVKELSTFNPLYISVTYGAGGTTQERTMELGFSIFTH